MPTKITKSDQEWRDQLTPEQYEVTRNAGTERAWTGPHLDEKREGMFRCVGCGTELFASGTKFESGTGWPSFTDPANLEHVELRDRQQPLHAPHRGRLQGLRRPSRPRLRRRPRRQRPALLHQRLRPELRAEAGVAGETRPRR